MDWPKPMWAGMAVAPCGLSTVGGSLNKGMQRFMGTLLAVLLALLVISLFAQDR